ncbi:MAG: hypothetical protein AAFO72_05230 [Pseudomonadota bacterium]
MTPFEELARIDPDLAAALEFARRNEKGLPADRLGSDEDLRAVGRGIIKLIISNGNLFAEIRQRGLDAMAATPDPMKASQKAGQP